MIESKFILPRADFGKHLCRLLPAMPMPAATSGTSARRNGFANFSSPMVTGMVGSPFASCWAHLRLARGQRLVVRLDGAGEFDVGGGVFVSAINLGEILELTKYGT